MTRETKSAPLWPLLLLVLVYPYLYERPREGYPPDEIAHVYLTRALVDNFSLRIGEQIKKYGDISSKIVVEGEVFASVPPGFAVLGAIPYAVQKLAYSVFGKEPSIAATMRWLRTVLIAVPVALFFLWLYFFLVSRSVRAHPARFAVLSTAIAAPVWLAGCSLSAPLLAGVLLLACLMLFGDESDWPSSFVFVIGGFFCGIAVALLAQAIWVVPLLALSAFSRARNPRMMSFFFVPVVASLCLLGSYNFFNFGHPITVDNHVWGMTAPSWSALKAMFWGTDGLLRVAPVMALALFGFFGMLLGGEARAAFVCFVSSMLLLIFSPNQAGLVAALVFWVWPLARTVETVSSVAGGTLLTGVLAVTTLLHSALALTTYPFFPDSYSNGLRDLALVLFTDGVFAANLGQRFGLSGGFSLLPLGLMLLGIAGALALGGAPRADGSNRRALSVLLLSISALWWQLSWSPDKADPRMRYRETLAIERALTRDGNADTRLQLRARRIEAGAGKDSREGRLARGQAATADGDNARAMEAYRGLYRR